MIAGIAAPGSGEDPSKIRRAVGLVLVALPLALQAAAVRLYGVNSLIPDELRYVPFVRLMREHGNWFPLLFQQHNEHRMVVRKMVFAALSSWTSWNSLAEMYFNVILSALVVWGMWKLFRVSGGNSVLRFSPQAWIVCGLGQWFNMTTGIQVAFTVTIVGWVWALYFLTRGSARGLAIASIFALAAAFSTLNGILIWPAGLIQLLLSKAPRIRVTSWLAVAASSTVAYFWGFQDAGLPLPTPPSAIFRHPLPALAFFLRNVGAPLAADNLHLALILGSLVSVAAVWLGPKRDHVQPFVWSLLVLGFGSAAMITTGRLSLNLPLESRYITFLNLVLLAFLLYRSNSRIRGLEMALFVVFTAGFAATEIRSVKSLATNWCFRNRQKWMLQTYASLPEGRLDKEFSPEPDLVNRLRYLETNRLSVFHDPVDALLNERWREGRAAGHILRGTPVRQTIVSPVISMQNVTVAFVTYRRRNTCTLQLSLALEGRTVGSRTVACADLRDNESVLVEVRPVIQDCLGKVFTIDIESPDASAGNSVTVWTYPSYFGGSLTQFGKPDIRGRSLGLQLNMHPRKLPFLPLPLDVDEQIL